MKTAVPASWAFLTMASTHSRFGCCFLLPGPVMAPMITHPTRSKGFSPPVASVSNGSKRGSTLTKVFALSQKKKGISGPVMVVPYQKFGSVGSFPALARSQYRFGFLVRNR